MSVAKQKRELAKLISGLKGIRGSGTELISVYIPAGYPIAETSNRLKNEYGQAGNIKSKTTRNNVQAALDKIISYLKTFRQTPKNGLALFAGNISKDPGKEDIQLFSVEPPLALQVSLYRCDSDFMLDPLIGQGRVKEKYGLVTIDGKDATVAILEGNVTKIVRRLATTGPSKTTKGGSCIHEDTIVQVEGRGNIPIKEVKEGDKVECLDVQNGKLFFSKCDAVMKRTAENCLHIVVPNGKSILATAEHRFFVKTKGQTVEKYADELKTGDLLLSSNGLVEIKDISSRNIKGHFYDLSVPGPENFLANSLIVHNSAARYQRYVEELIENYYRRVGQAMDETLMASDIRKVIVGGPGPVKDNFLKMKAFNYQFQILAVLDTGYVDDYGIQELARKAVDVIAEEKAVKEKKLLEKFFLEISKGGLAAYGAHDTIAAMNSGKIDTLMLSEKLNSKHLKIKCKNGDEEEIVVDPEVDRKLLRCPLDHAVEEVLAEKDFFDEMYDRADAKGIEVETISEETNEGKQFLAGFKGIGAILKYR